MAKATQPDKPRIFISHSWDDKALVRQLETELKAAGADVWVDHAGIRGGDNLPKRISDALEWCNALLLVWSKAASESRWVELEWTNAISLNIAIIPCCLDGARLPAILAHKAYLDFRDVEKGISQLLAAMNLAQSAFVPPVKTTTEQVARVIHNRLAESHPSVKPRPAQILLRAQPLNAFDQAGVEKMLEAKHYFDRRWNAKGRGLVHQYEAVERQGKKLVIDHTTALTWQQSGAEKYMPFEEAEKYIQELKREKYASYDDWRLPTLEEAMSLMEPSTKNGDLYIDPIFDKTQRWIWTADKRDAGVAWAVYFDYGYCTNYTLYDGGCVRAVR